jgi:hypothetical protein
MQKEVANYYFTYFIVNIIYAEISQHHKILYTYKKAVYFTDFGLSRPLSSDTTNT